MPRYYVEIEGKELGFDILEGHEGTLVRYVDPEREDAEVRVDLSPVHASAETGEGLYSILANNKSYQLYVARSDEGYRMTIWRHRFDVKVLSEREWRLQKVAPKHAAYTGRLVLSAPMPGLVKQVVVSVGDEVKAGERLIVLEAMKMENDINSPRDGKLAEVHVTAGAVVEGGKPLVTLE